jgi:prepilin-type N-terminal cleavage/methylation domain-containing protein
MSIRRHRAFTLVELLCVIGIIGILVALCLGVFPKAIGRANRISYGTAEGQTNILKMIEADDGH